MNQHPMMSWLLKNPTYTVSAEKHLNLTHRRSVFLLIKVLCYSR